METNDLTIDELKTEIIECIREIKPKHYDDKVWKRCLINVLNNQMKELLELEIELDNIEEVIG